MSTVAQELKHRILWDKYCPRTGCIWECSYPGIIYHCLHQHRNSGTVSFGNINMSSMTRIPPLSMWVKLWWSAELQLWLVSSFCNINKFHDSIYNGESFVMISLELTSILMVCTDLKISLYAWVCSSRKVIIWMGRVQAIAATRPYHKYDNWIPLSSLIIYLR